MDMAGQFRWALKLIGPRLDLDTAIWLYKNNADPTISPIDDGDGKPAALLTSPQFEVFDNSEDVEDVSKRLLGVVNGVTRTGRR
jgi:hypothetical protein